MFRPSPNLEELRSALSSIISSLQAPVFVCFVQFDGDCIFHGKPWNVARLGMNFVCFHFCSFLRYSLLFCYGLWSTMMDGQRQCQRAVKAKTNDQPQVPVLTTVDLKLVRYKSHGVFATMLFSGNASPLSVVTRQQTELYWQFTGPCCRSSQSLYFDYLTSNKRGSCQCAHMPRQAVYNT